MTEKEAISLLEAHTQYYIPADDIPAFTMALDALIDARDNKIIRKFSGTTCKFCKTFNFSGISTEITKYGAHVKLATGNTQYPIDEQFNYCPVCGRYLKGG